MIVENKNKLEEIKLIGLALKGKTTNENGQSSIDCGNLWQKFLEGKYASKIPGKVSEEMYAVYHEYEGDHTQPFSYFIGCKVSSETDVPQDLDSLIIPTEIYQKVIAKGKMPDCVMNAWKEIWQSDIDRAFKIDFEIYGEKAKSWDDAEVEIYLSIK